MRKIAFIALAMALIATPAIADLQNVQVGGEITIRGNWYSNTFASPGGFNLAWPSIAGVPFLGQRSVGDFVTWTAGGTIPAGNGAIAGVRNNGAGIFSPFSWSDRSNSAGFVEQHTRLNVKADFTSQVCMLIELDSYDVWGEDFRSDHITGFDRRAASGNDVEIYQAFIEANEMWGMPLRLRIGRQELSFGSEWLVGVNDSNSLIRGLSFDAARLTYATDVFSVDAWAAILAEGGIVEEDEDVAFYGIYGSYLGLENITIDAYWMWVRDARSLNDTNFPWFVEWVEDWIGVDDYDVTNIHTIGLRGAGTIGAFDFEAEAAYQWGDAGQVGFVFKPFLYGDDDADYGEWAGNLEVGYTFDMTWQPRVYLGAAYFGGEDNRDVDFWDWINPFDSPQASVSFNRLFSNVEYSQFLDTSADLSNAYVIRGGVSAMPTESIEVLLNVAWFEALEEFDSPVYWNLGGFRIPIAPALPWWTTANDTSLGWEVNLVGTYHYTEDLTFEAGYSHFFVGDGLSEGNFNSWNGLLFNGGRGDDDADYLYFETKLAF